MAMTLSNADLRRLLPVFMQDDDAVISLAEAVNELIRGPGSKVKRIREWDQFDNLTEAELDELAYEMGIDWYDPTVPIANKRATISAAKLLKDKSGTAWAIVEAVKAAYGAVPEITEWHEYDPAGTPGHFKLEIQAQDTFDFARILRAVNFVKRASSVLDGTQLDAELSAPIFIGFAMVTVRDYTNDMTAT